MKNRTSWIFVFFVICSTALAGIDLKFSKEKVKQGSIQKVQVIMDEDLKRDIDIKELEGKSIQDTLYVQSVEKAGAKTFFVVIFTKVPEKLPLAVKVGSVETTLGWNNITIEPIEIPNGFLFGDFTIKDPLSYFLIGVCLLVFLIILIFARKFTKKLKTKRAIKARRRELLDSLFLAKNFEEVVSVWQKKHVILDQFPHLTEPFKSLEIILFKYQFKPFQTLEEQQEVLNAYRLFLDVARGEKNGI